jgi:hypothetical protein
LITQKGLDVLHELEPKVIEHEGHLLKNLNTEELAVKYIIRKIQKSVKYTL